MRNLLRKLRSAWQLSFRQKLWFVLCYPLSGIVRAMVLTIPFKWLKRLLGVHHKNFQLCPLVTDEQLSRACEIGRTIAIIDKYTPWKSNCMVEAILSRWLLAVYDIPYALYMGAYLTKNPNEPMKAHAWVRVGSRIIVGARGHKRYGVTATFLDKSLVKF